MWNTKKSPAGSDVELRSFVHHDALRPEEYSAHAPDSSVLGSEKRASHSRHPRWKIGIRYCALAAGVVFLFNLIFLLVGENRSGFLPINSNGGKRVVYDGDCDTTKRINIVVHMLINVLSTILLGASNYCMQCMSAPTRAEVDRAHKKSEWVDIGVPSIRNLGKVRKLRAFLWLIMGVSSLPLHLFYNSTVYASVSASVYNVFTVNEAFLDPLATNYTEIGANASKPDSYTNAMLKLYRSDSLERLNTSDCVGAYAQNYQTARRNVLLVVSDSTKGFTSGATLDFETNEYPITDPNDSCPQPFQWICTGILNSDDCLGSSCQSKISGIQSQVAEWKPFGKTIEYCMSEKIDQHCRLQYSVHLVIVVIIIGLLKTVAMLFISFRISDTPMMTIGDAVSSFLIRPDATTKGICLLNKSSLKDFRIPASPAHGTSATGGYSSIGWSAPPQTFDHKKRLHISAASGRRLSLFIITYGILIGVTIFLLIYGVVWFKGDQSEAYGQGLGAIDARSFITWELPQEGTAGLIANVIVANIPQLLLSFLYLNYNGLMTVMSLSREWARYGVRRQGLRVSMTRKGAQRSTYFLQLPYRFGLPIIVITGTLHWLISQSIFLVSVDAYKAGASIGSLITCGYSPPAILATIIVIVVLIVILAVVGFRRLPSSMPVAGSCSIAIAAACHAVPEPFQKSSEAIEENAADAEVQWGVMGSDDKGIGHCGFSMYAVDYPEQGKLYA
ncbi:hypothetical protein P153DRAFT_398181 [Dothidotthia symphoricarpi CBS 119687]|uniref:DUF6536 domain-containing protein n=1 Tax=Dothidotthia symphoricarpi CBS 119687 TaxID=1392245 RepID=A0A6A6A8P3_9PLEO|nr:uncharacterized protein P153DRAFT_398181 [Dothidotthia symphoricarpi CBS 119687]KAF2127575.1 hypothetical protein P153DRAFT_398181 [Dothidotthia symphoricarpi CBS 119687]